MLSSEPGFEPPHPWIARAQAIANIRERINASQSDEESVSTRAHDGERRRDDLPALPKSTALVALRGRKRDDRASAIGVGRLLCAGSRELQPAPPRTRSPRNTDDVRGVAARDRRSRP